MKHAPPRIREVRPGDAPAIAAIYNHYIEETVVTFEEQPLAPAEMASRIDRLTDLGLPWIVLEAGQNLRGYACAGPWHTRSAFRYSVESSVYLDPGETGRGHGRQLYSALIRRLGEGGSHSVIAAIALPNPASVALHENLGFTRAGTLREVGFKFGKWIDVGYWQRLLDGST